MMQFEPRGSQEAVLSEQSRNWRAIRLCWLRRQATHRAEEPAGAPLQQKLCRLRRARPAGLGPPTGHSNATGHGMQGACRERCKPNSCRGSHLVTQHRTVAKLKSVHDPSSNFGSPHHHHQGSAAGNWAAPRQHWLDIWAMGPQTALHLFHLETC